jgi:cytochrome c biogenesis protein CcmG/thiol:disulfide interchange protein DsbE
MKRLSTIIPVAVFAIFAAALYLGLSNDPTRIPSVLIDKPVPSFNLKPVNAGGPGLASRDIRGRVSLINVFGSWCAICRVEHPTLLSISNAIPIYGIDWKDAPADGAAWIIANGNPYQRIGNDESGRTALDLGVTGAPETFVVDRNGRIRFKQVGPITPEVWSQTIEPLVRKLERET